MTTRAASASAQMLNSEAADEFPTSWPPPMMIVVGMRSTMRGSSFTAMATLVSGPTGRSAISSVVERYVSMRNSTACAACLVERAAGMGDSSPWTSPLRPVTSRGIGKSRRAIGVPIP